MRYALTALLLLMPLAACGPDNGWFCSRSVLPDGALPPTVALTDEASTIEVRLPVAFSCASGPPQARRATVQVLDAEGSALEAEVSAPVSTEAAGYTARVSFVPRAPGLVRLLVRFEPGLGLAEREVLVLQRRADAAAQALPGLEACAEVEVTTAGALVCVTEAGRLLVFRGGATAQDEAALGGVVSANDVWTWTEDTVTRWRDDGAGPLAKVGEVRLGLPFTGAGGVLSAQGLLLASRSRLVRVQDTSGLSVTLDTPLSLAIPAASGRVRLVLGEDGSLGLALGAAVCRVPVAVGAAASCYDVTGQALAEEGDGFWFSAAPGVPEVPRFIRLLGAPPTPVTREVGPLPADLQRSTGAGVPTWLWQSRLVAPRARGERFDAFPAVPPGAAVVRASPRVVVLRDAAGATQWVAQ